MAKAKNIALWVLQILLAAAFVTAGGGKLGGTSAMVQVFDAVGMGQWFRYLTGAIEVGSAILLLIPRMAGFGAGLLTCVMAGAIVAHLTKLHSPPGAPAILLVLALIVLWGRWRDLSSRLRPQTA
jgi:putative oxidoreductase